MLAYMFFMLLFFFFIEIYKRYIYILFSFSLKNIYMVTEIWRRIKIDIHFSFSCFSFTYVRGEERGDMNEGQEG